MKTVWVLFEKYLSDFATTYPIAVAPRKADLTSKAGIFLNDGVTRHLKQYKLVKKKK